MAQKHIASSDGGLSGRKLGGTVIRSRFWREFEAGDTGPLRTLRRAIFVAGVLFLGWTATLVMGWPDQLILAFLTLLAAVVLDRCSKSHVVTLTLVLLSIYSTVRYGFWRSSSVLAYFRDPGSGWTALEAFFIWMLLLAELYAVMVLLLGYLQTLWPLGRAPVPLPGDPEEWPAVDLLIPTYNEPLAVVRFTALAAMNIDWPADKLNVYLLDDGKREEFRAFAEEAGVGYIARDNNVHAKAGNINHALRQLHSPFVAVFDCDHVPTRSFLQLTMGWFLRDPKLALLQTPQRAYSPDPFERNLGQFHVTPNEDELFYGVVQDGNDFWNATFFCGSCGVLRRSALDEVGGIAVETVTEDAHTSLRLQKRGWNSAYVNIAQAAGLANERLSSHIRQRIRWARGMVQILRLENPLFARGLKPAQRLCYFNAMSHFLYALPRLIFLTAPVIYLIFGIRNLPGFWLAIVAYAVPHLVLAGLANSRIQGAYRHSFWNEIYETVLAPYILLPTLFALIRPRSGAFHVTPKGGVVREEYFDARIARPFLLLAAFNFAGLLCAVARFFQLPRLPVAGWLSFLNWPTGLYDRSHAGTILVNVFWALFNLTILGVATAVAWESQQRRRAVRVAVAVPADVILADGSMVQGMTCDLSSGGVRTNINQPVEAKAGDAIRFVLPVLDGSATLPAKVVSVQGNELRARFDPLNLQEDEALTMVLYSRANAWVGSEQRHEADRPALSMFRILRLSLGGLAHTVLGFRRRRPDADAGFVPSVLPLILVAIAMTLSPRAVYADATHEPLPVQAEAQPPPGEFTAAFSLSQLGVQDAIRLDSTARAHTISFAVPRMDLVTNSVLRLQYHFSPGLQSGAGRLDVVLNGTSVGSLAAGDAAGNGSMQQAVIALPSELLVHDNQITFRLDGGAPCQDNSTAGWWAQVDGASTIQLSGSLLPLADNLNLLPLPFFDEGTSLHPAVPIVFLGDPSLKSMQAAGMIASWLGELYGARPVQFPVSIGTLPPGDAIVLADQPSEIPQPLGLTPLPGPSVAMVTNPANPAAKLLVLTGNGPDQLLTAAAGLLLEGTTWQGSRVQVGNLVLPAGRAPDDAPRWLSTDDSSAGASFREDLQGDGSAPLSVYFRLPPDLSFGSRQNLAYHLSYRYNGAPLGDGSTLQVFVNGAYVSSTPMPHTDHASPVLETVIPVPVVDLRPFSNTITFRFAFIPRDKGCGNSMPPNLEGAILKDSYLDVSGIPHSATLPNLELFANAGYPFTRRADLADTAVVLPEKPSPWEIELFLALMGHFGAQTGYPALRITVTGPAGFEANSGRDFIVIGAEDDQPALRTLDGSLPVEFEAGGLKIHDTRGILDRAAWWRDRNSKPFDAGELETQGQLPDALIEAIEWPRRSNHSVVAIILRGPAAAPGFISAFLGASQSSQISGSVSVLHGSQFSSYRLRTDLYRAGQSSSFIGAVATFEDKPWLIAMVTVLFCFLMGALLETMLRRRARVRLQAGSSH